MAHAPVAQTPVRDAKTAESGAKTAQFDPIAGGPCQEKRTADRAAAPPIGGSGGDLVIIDWQSNAPPQQRPFSPLASSRFETETRQIESAGQGHDVKSHPRP